MKNYIISGPLTMHMFKKKKKNDKLYIPFSTTLLASPAWQGLCNFRPFLFPLLCNQLNDEIIFL